MSVVDILITAVVGSIITAPFLWLAGRWIVGGEKAKFMDAVWIGVLGTVLNVVIGAFVGGGVGALAQLVAYLYLVKKYYETGWGNAAIISILTVVLMVVLVAALVVLLGVDLGGLGLY